MTRRSHGDGRRMSLAEARERRARMIRVHGSLDDAHDHGDEVAAREGGTSEEGEHRDWNCWECVLCGAASRAAQDVGLRDGVPVAMCADCRAARTPAVEFETETLEDLAADFMADLARILPEPSCADPSPPQGEP